MLITQVAPGVFHQDLAFIIHAGVDGVTVYGGLPRAWPAPNKAADQALASPRGGR